MGEVVYLDNEQWQNVPDPRVDVEGAVIVSLAEQRLRREIRQLPVLERKVVCWRNGLLGEKLGVREVADRLGIPRSTAYDIERRAMARLRVAYGVEAA
jgi:DNA-directed RNA polymerase specialized sigma24 family protein